jgi:hypothetical protein
MLRSEVLRGRGRRTREAHACGQAQARSDQHGPMVCPKKSVPFLLPTQAFQFRDSMFCELSTSGLRLAVRRGNVLYAEESDRFFPVRLLTDA